MKMQIKVFTTNHNGKIEFTKAELEKLLNDTYAEGQKNCNCGKGITWTSPYSYPAYLGDNSASANNASNAAVEAPTIKININEADAQAASKCINDVFAKLSKELNF
jgi:hypothetical protein